MFLALLGGIFGFAKAVALGAVTEAFTEGANISAGYGVYVEIVRAILALVGYGLCRALEGKRSRTSF